MITSYTLVGKAQHWENDAWKELIEDLKESVRAGIGKIGANQKKDEFFYDFFHDLCLRSLCKFQLGAPCSSAFSAKDILDPCQLLEILAKGH